MNDIALKETMLWVAPVSIFILIGVVAFFAGVETGLFSVSRAKIRNLAQRGDRRAQIIAKLLERPEYFIGTALVGINLAHVTLSVVSSFTFNLLLPNPRWSAVLTTVIVTPLVLFFGEIIPKSVFRLRPHAGSLFFARPFQWCTIILKPITASVLWLARHIIPGGNLRHEPNPEHRRDEIQSMVRVGMSVGVVEDDEKEMIESVFELAEKTVREVMVPRVSMAAVPANWTYEEVLAYATSEAYTRFPVFDRTPDRIVGILHVADLLNREKFSLLTVKKPLYIPETAKVDDALEQLRKAGAHLAIVVDEYGGTAGLVTIEDFLEELVGEIDDEHDDSHAMVVRLGDSAWAIDARADLEEVAEEVGCTFESDSGEVETVGGFVLEALGRIPKPGEELIVGAHRLRVTAADDRRVIRVEIERVPPSELESEDIDE